MFDVKPGNPSYGKEAGPALFNPNFPNLSREYLFHKTPPKPSRGGAQPRERSSGPSVGDSGDQQLRARADRYRMLVSRVSEPEMPPTATPGVRSHRRMARGRGWHVE